MSSTPPRARRLSIAGLLVAAGLALHGCGRPQNDPAAVLRGFFAAAAEGDSEAAVMLLSRETIEALGSRLEAAREAAGIADDTPRRALLVERLHLRLARNYSDMRVIEAPAVPGVNNKRARVEVIDHRDRTEIFELTSEDGRWRVVLPMPS